MDVIEREIEGVRIRVATPRSLYEMKKGTVRPIDHADAAALRAAFDTNGEASFGFAAWMSRTRTGRARTFGA